MQLFALGLILFLAFGDAWSYSEREYTEDWCLARGGSIDLRLADRTRVDCLLDDYAIEFDFTTKWAEAPSQALHYARMTNRMAAVVIIVESARDCPRLQRLHNLIYYDKIGVLLFETGPYAYRCI